MITGPELARDLRDDEVDAVDRLLCAAFPTPQEAELVRVLRGDSDIHSELVINWEGEIAAYAALSFMLAPESWLCLAPVAVLPKYQAGAAAPSNSQRDQFRLGTRLVTGIAVAASAHGVKPLGPTVVYGAPRFYGRCGFSSDRAARLNTPYEVQYTLLAAPGDDVPEETLVYPKSFDATD